MPAVDLKAAMKYHPLSADVPWPHCGKGALQYERSQSYGLHGDVYRCGICRGGTVHRRRKGMEGCGVVAVLAYGRAGHDGPTVGLCRLDRALAAPVNQIDTTIS